MEDERWLMMAVLDHLQTASRRDGMNASSLEEAIFAISNAYALNMRNAATRQRYPLHDLSLVDVFKAGRTQLLQQQQNGSARASSQHQAPPNHAQPNHAQPNHAQPNHAANDAESPAFERFLQRLKQSTTFFDGVQEGSDEYANRVQRARDKFESKRAAKRVKATTAAATNGSEAQGASTSEQNKARAEQLKHEGNQKLKEKQYADALQLYDESIRLCPQNAVYHSNRAAANMLLRRFEEAVRDCERAIELDATFLRPRERLAHAYRQMGRTADEVGALKHALQLDGTNESLKRQLDDANLRLRGSSGGGGGGGVGSREAAMPAMEDLMGGGGGNMEEMISRLGRDGVSNMASMLGFNVPQQALDDLFANGGLQQMQNIINNNPEMVQQTMQRLMRGDLPSPWTQPGAGGANAGGGS